MDKCIRDSADIKQLKRCKQELTSLNSSIQRLSTILSLAGNSVRFKILYLLHKEKMMCPCDISDVLEMTIPAISQHLKKMWEGNLVSKEKKGQTIFYSLNTSNTEQLNPFFDAICSYEIID